MSLKQRVVYEQCTMEGDSRKFCQKRVLHGGPTKRLGRPQEQCIEQSDFNLDVFLLLMRGAFVPLILGETPSFAILP